MNASLEPKKQEQGRNTPRNGSQSAKVFPSRTIVHAKLEMTEPGDHDEQEADAVATAIMNGGKISRKISSGTSGSSGITVSQQMESQLSHLQGNGRQMPLGLRNIMESGFGQDFSQVRLHTDGEAATMSRSISAKAFTYGNDIFFNQGQFDPDTMEGRHLIAHELTHTVQQAGKVAREENPDAMPKDARNIRVTDQEKDEVQLRQSLVSVLDGHIEKSKTIKAPPSRPPVLDKAMIANMPPRKLELYNRWMGAYLDYVKEPPEPFIRDVILPDCLALIEIARATAGDTKRRLVQQLYNTLAQVSVALDILPKPDPEGNSVDSLRDTLWISCRNKFNEVVKSLAKLARNPAIAVLMYEGTYYPSNFNKITTSATDKMVDENDFSDLLFYGAVCNNAAYGSVRASGAEYQKKDNKGTIKPFKGLSSESREKWSSYNLQGDGYGENALKDANQGDIVVFWNLSQDYIKASLLDKYVEWCLKRGLHVSGSGPKLADLQAKIKKQKKDSEKKKAEKEYNEAKEPVWKALMDEAKRTGGAIFDDLIDTMNVDASHIEVIVGVNDENHTYLTSGAHGSREVNGFSRTAGGNLDWKSAENVRNKRVMRRIPLAPKEKEPLIAVNIPSIMQNQQYDTVVKDKEATDAMFVAMHEERLKKEHDSTKGAIKELTKDDALKKEYESLVKASENNYKKGEYSHINVYYTRNVSSSVTIDWIGIPAPVQDTAEPDPQLVEAPPLEGVPINE